jgi:hypothetical protein
MIAKERWAGTSGYAVQFACGRVRRSLVCGESLKRGARKVLVAFANEAYQFEKERKRAWRPFMLRRTLVR